MPYLLQCGPHRLVLGGRTLIMGILNVTPDSFSDGGCYLEPDAAVARARAMVAEGADIIDVGAESTRPGHTAVTAETELERLLPVLRALRAADLGVPVSVDTRKAAVVRAAAGAGADLINDTDGLQGDPEMAAAVADTGLPAVVMHNRPRAFYPDGVMADLHRYFRESIRRAEAAGIPRQRLILDPGFGFGKEPEHNLEITHRLQELRSLGHPLLFGPSRKSTIGKVLDLPVSERVEGTAALVALAVERGVEIVRVHDVQAMVRVARMVEAVRAAGAAAAGRASDCTIALEGMEFYGYHGVYEEERRLGQRFRVDVQVALPETASPGAPTGSGGSGDRLESTLDYARLYDAVSRVVQGEPVQLLETLAGRIAAAVGSLGPVRSVKVRIEKPSAPVPGIFRRAVVERTFSFPEPAGEGGGMR